MVEETTSPAYEKIREHFSTVLHPDSETMKSFEYGEEDSRIVAQPLSEFDPEAELPFAGLDAPLGG